MSQSPSALAPIRVVFDLGGVLAEVSHTWNGAAQRVGIDCPKLQPATPLADAPGFEAYQSGSMSLAEYLNALADFAGCHSDDALRLHNGILGPEFPGVLEVVQELKSRGIPTGCLSNTNAPHWEVLLSGGYPAIEALEMKMASHLAGLSKPDPRLFDVYAKTFGLRPESIVFFDDNLENVRSALSLSWQARQIQGPTPPSDQLRSYLTQLGVI